MAAMVTDSGTYKQTVDKDKSIVNWATHDLTRRDLIFAQRTFFVFLPPHKWHIWFCPTHKPTLRKTKRATFLPTLNYIHNLNL
ncbi:MAG TPA: hypothetical protein PKU77_12655 [Ferruginibacter sp.]|nr:hypothetical protein [Ferruginibacter sp.]